MSDRSNISEQDPVTQQQTTSGWLAWVRALVTSGRERLAQVGVTLILGFGLAVLALFAFARLADDVLERETQALDDAVLAWMRQVASPPLDLAARGVTTLGSEAVLAFLLLLLVGFAVRRQWGAAVSLLLVTGGAQMLNNVLKDLFHRTRPSPVAGLIPAQAFSFPSGHATVSAAFYLFIAYLGWRMIRGRWQRVTWAAGLMLVVLLIGLSRLYLGVHYFTDVIAGYVAGFTWADSVIIAGRLLGGPWRRRSGSRLAASGAGANTVPVGASLGDAEPPGRG